MRRLTAALFVALAAMGSLAAEDAPDASEILERSFAHRYGYDFLQRVHLLQRDRVGDERTIVLEMAQKTFNDRLHGLVRFTSPPSLVGTRVLTIEAAGRLDDHFVYLKSRRQIRRVTARRGDSFLGTDFTMEDMERREVSDFNILSMTTTSYEGEPVFQIDVEPVYESSYDSIRYIIAASDYSTLHIRYSRKNYKTGEPEVVKEFTVPRAAIEKIEGVLIGKHAFVRDLRLQSETHIYIDDVFINPMIKNKIFSAALLENDHKFMP